MRGKVLEILLECPVQWPIFSETKLDRPLHLEFGRPGANNALDCWIGLLFHEAQSSVPADFAQGIQHLLDSHGDSWEIDDTAAPSEDFFGNPPGDQKVLHHRPSGTHPELESLGDRQDAVLAIERLADDA